MELKISVEGRNSSEKMSEIAPGFHTLSPDTRLTTTPTQTNANEIKIDNKGPIALENPNNVRIIVYKPTVFGTILSITHVCLGNFAIFSFAPKTKNFGLVWMIVFCILIAYVNYWAIMRSFAASIKCKDYNYSELTEQFLGKRASKIINILIIGYSFLCMMYLTSLTFPLMGRIIKLLLYNEQYELYETFSKEKWEKGFIKFPFFITIGFCSFVVNYFKFIRLKFVGIFRIVAISLCILYLLIECNSYYNYYKQTIYNKNDKRTYPNWTNLKSAFTTKMEFFKGICILFASYTCMPIMFPIFEGFKIQENPLKKTQMSVAFGILLTTVLSILSIICSYLINPYSPEELIIFRRNKNGSKDILMMIINFILIICIILTIPRYYLMVKINFKQLFFKNKNKLSEKLNNIFTFIFCFGSALASISFDHYLSYLCYIGGFFSVFISYLFPVLIFVKSSDKKMKYWFNIIQIIFACFLCVIGIIGGISTLVDDIRN